MKKSVGYSFWGFLGDRKYNQEQESISTPDGNAFYSWSIIHELMQRGYDVFRIMPDRDLPGYALEGKYLFNSFCRHKRRYVYENLFNIPYKCDMNWFGDNIKNEIFELFDIVGLKQCEFILHEWRMPIDGRNVKHTCSLEDFQPDLVIQDILVEYCVLNNIKLYVFDLDYKLTKANIEWLKLYDNVKILELGYKHIKDNYGNNKYIHCEIPFSFEDMNEFTLFENKPDNKLIYIGNRYERDWCIDKYIPKSSMNCVKVYGNWLEGNRDSKEKWPTVNFEGRLNICDFSYVYGDSAATILLAKKEYLENGFMTARILESVFFGCVPLFISEYGPEIINKYAGVYADLLVVDSKADVIDKCNRLYYDVSLRIGIINYLREYLKFMDVSNFVDMLEEN